MIAKAAGCDHSLREEALNALCRAYWEPVYAFIRSKGRDKADAQDLTQSFFAEFLMRDQFGRADSDKGKLRTFLLSSVQNFMAKDVRAGKRIKRGRDVSVVALDFINAEGEGGMIEPEDHLTPEVVFERQWALTVLEAVVRSLEKRYEASGKGELFRALRFVISPGAETESYREIARKLGMKENAIRTSVFRLRQRYALELRETIADTVVDDSEIENEIDRLRKAFS